MEGNMKALSVRQPWALQINDGEKNVEYRTWQTDYRGELLICASKSSKPVWIKVEIDGGEQILPAPMGCQMCVVNLVDIQKVTREEAEAEQMEWSPSLCKWIFDGGYTVEPTPVKGKLHLFEVPDEMIFPIEGDHYWCDFDYEGRDKVPPKEWEKE